MINLKIENAKPVQKDFWGNGAVYHGYAGMPDDAGRVYSEKLCEIEAKRVADMRLKIARTFYRWWAWDSETNTWNWDNEIMTPFYKWLQRMKDSGVTIALNTGWWCPKDVCYENTPFYVEGDWDACLKNFADWVSETAYQLIEKRGFDNIKIFVMFTEPQHCGIDDSNGIPMIDGMDAYTCWYEATKAAHDALVRDGRRHLLKLMGPNEGSTVTSKMLKWSVSKVDEFIDIYSSHNYLSTGLVPYGIVDENSDATMFFLAGSRVHRQINLKKNEEYTINVEYHFASVDNDIIGNVVFGVFEDRGIKDLYSNSEDILFSGTEKNSVLTIAAKDVVGKKNKLSYKFISSETKTAIAGFFYDVKTPGVAVLTKFEILDKNCKALYDNCDFSPNNNDWTYFHCADFSNNYNAWCKWCKTGMQYVPENKPYCFDEYNASYNKDKSVINHGADIVTALVALMNCGVQSSLLWTLFDQQWPNSHNTSSDCFVDGDHRWGIMPVLTRSLVPYSAFYAFGIVSRYVDGFGTKIFMGENKERVSTTMSVSKYGDITIVVVNDKEYPDEFSINFKKSLDSIKFNRHTFDPNILVPNETATLPGIDKVTEPITKTLTDKIAPYGVIVYTTHMD